MAVEFGSTTVASLAIGEAWKKVQENTEATKSFEEKIVKLLAEQAKQTPQAWFDLSDGAVFMSHVRIRAKSLVISMSNAFLANDVVGLTIGASERFRFYVGAGPSQLSIDLAGIVIERGTNVSIRRVSGGGPAFYAYLFGSTE